MVNTIDFIIPRCKDTAIFQPVQEKKHFFNKTFIFICMHAKNIVILQSVLM